MFVIRRVVGTSMLPALKPNQIVLAYKTRRFKVGDIVIVAHDGKEKIKRISELQAGKVFVVGDNEAESTDSRQFGWLNTRQLIAKVVFPRN